MNLKKIMGILSLVVVISGLILAPVLAGDNIPSKKELEYAKAVYNMIHQFDQKETAFVEELKAVPTYETGKIQNAFRNKFNYTKKLYLSIQALQPTSKFANIHQKLLEGLYGNLQYLKVVNTELTKGVMINDISKKYNNMFKESNVTYETASTDFMDVVRSWQRPYIDQVKPPNKVN